MLIEGMLPSGIKTESISKKTVLIQYWNEIYRVTLRLKKCEIVVSASGRMKEVMPLHLPY